MSNKSKPLSLKKADMLLRAKGSRLMLMHSNRPGEPKAYYVVPGGYVTPAVAEELISRSYVISNNDGLLPDSPQSWSVINC